ncbi:MAG: protocatechuate 3,4-dioxygenase [Acidimicrobiales bacterium]|nr:class III extradiol dioxygenase subunit beta [Acidimicrobiaceae bacterium]MDE0676345.1 class III extradiol dioxygenase subunit beta [Acidimicrobiaceae bacterium]MXV88332.1 protocatechuate 3,4-dioxygenase [Acidimicrobiales bacterium]MYB82389.1 protocatechuate 3,4-dioxygenase [Acidimicrobiales bacterium]MYI10942.1 protocatechuate 3,4-dioxygenase [Acidimicrobiales bacterium]
MTTIVGGIGTSHVPAVGAAIDNGKQGEPYWRPYFDKIQPAREWMAAEQPDVCIIVYNDHASAFSLRLIPTFALGVAAEYQPADEGYGRRGVPAVSGDPELAWHLAESLIGDEFDITIVNEMDVDHGLTVPLSVMYGEPEAWPCRVIPICVNVIQYPPPSGKRCLSLGRAIRRALDSYEGSDAEGLRVAVLGTGGMSHQLQGERAGLVNTAFDTAFMDELIADPDAGCLRPHTEYVREAGSEGIELVMWFVMRGVLDNRVDEVFRMSHVPTSNTSNGLLILQNAQER